MLRYAVDEHQQKNIKLQNYLYKLCGRYPELEDEIMQLAEIERGTCAMTSIITIPINS